LNTNIALPSGSNAFLVISSSAFCIAFFPLYVVSRWNAAGKKKGLRKQRRAAAFQLVFRVTTTPFRAGVFRNVAIKIYTHHQPINAFLEQSFTTNYALLLKTLRASTNTL